jgi:hypothetical protein
LATGLSAGVVGGVGAFSISRLDRALTALFADAPDHVLRRLPLVAQQLWAIAGLREMDLLALYEHRFGRLTLPVRWLTRRMRRIRAATRRSRGG